MCEVPVWICVPMCVDPAVCADMRLENWGWSWKFSLITVCLVNWEKCSCLISFDVIKHWSEATWGTKGSRFHVIIHLWGRPRQELKLGTWSQGLKQRMWRDTASRLDFYGTLNFISCAPQYHWPRDCISHVRLCLHPTTMPQRQTHRDNLMETILPVEIPSSHICASFC